MGTMTGINRWWSNPTRKRCCSGPPTGSRPHRAASPVRSAAARTPRRCASRGPGSHPRGSNAGPVHETPCARASPTGPKGTPRYRASSRDRSAGRTPWPGIVRYREMFAPSGCHGNARQSARTCSRAGNPSVARTASCRRSWAGPPRKRLRETASNFKSTPPKIAGKRIKGFCGAQPPQKPRWTNAGVGVALWRFHSERMVCMLTMPPQEARTLALG